MDRHAPDLLIAETAWVRRLALSLVRDEAAADDLLQDAYLIAAERPPPEGRPIRPWLARVVTNLARMRGRSGARRTAREQRTGEDTAEPLRPDQLVERVETQQRLAKLVLELGEAYRDVVLLHYFEELTSTEIARRLGISDGTVRWRLKHALDELRAGLDATSGGRRSAWLPAVAGLARPWAATGALTMKKLIAAAVVFVLLLVSAVVYVATRRHGEIEPARSSSSSWLAGSGAAHAASPAWGVPTNAPRRRIAGHVELASVAVAGAHVSLRLATQPDTELAGADTRADGIFELGSPPATSYLVIATAATHSAAIVTIDTADPRAAADHLVLVLGDCSARAVGTITDAARTPIPHARVRLERHLAADADADGRYNVCLPAGGALVTFSAEGYGEVATQFSLDGVTRRDVMLVPEGILVGRVVRADTGAPVGDARVAAISADRTLAELSAVDAGAITTSDGRFQIGGLAPGRLVVVAVADGLGSDRIETAIEGGTSRELVITVWPRAHVRGRVVANGQPVASARVSTTSAGDSAHAWSNADGTFELANVKLGPVAWEVRGYDLAAPGPARIDRVTQDGVTLSVAAGTSLRGHVTAHGAPVQGAEVTWIQVERGYTATTDATGAFEIDNLEPGAGSVMAHSAISKAFAAPKPLTLAARVATDVAIDLDLEASVSGVVVDEQGAPVPEVYVSFNAPSDTGEGMTDAQGAFHLCCMSGGADYISVVYPTPGRVGAFEPAHGKPHARVHIPDGKSQITGVILAIRNERQTIRGHLVDDTGAAVADARVVAAMMMPPGTTSSDLAPSPSAVSDATGAFELRDLATAGDRGYVVRAHGADGSEGTVNGVAAGARNVVITLPRAGAIEGTATGFTTLPTIAVSDRGATLRSVTLVNAKFSFTGLPPATYQVGVQDASGLDARTVTVTAGATAHVDLASHGTGRIEGRVTAFGTNAPMAAVGCSVSGAADGMGLEPNPIAGSTAMTDATGHFVIDPAPAGVVRVQCALVPMISRIEVTVAPGAAASAAIELVASNGNRCNPGFNLYGAQLPPTAFALNPGGPAVRAGLQAGDQIVSVDGASTAPLGTDGTSTLIQNHAQGTVLTLGILRSGTAKVVAITVE